jgi:hypothetical protein
MSRPLPLGSPRRLPAGALLLVLTVSVIVATILLSLILLGANRRHLMQQDAWHEQLRRNLFSGLAYAQATPELPAFQPQLIDLFGNGEDSVQLVRKPWGLFDVAVLNARKGPFRDTVVALLGTSFSSINRAALYLTDENVPLAVNDDAQVRGTAWVPKKGEVRPASLPLVGPRRVGEPVSGKVKSSAPRLPFASDSALARLQEYASLQLEKLLPAGSRPAKELGQATRSFLGLPLVWYHEGAFTVQRAVGGQVVIVSSRRLLVDATSRLNNVLLVAPTIIVKAGFQGRVQLLARDTVQIEENCRLAYPSAACAYGEGKQALVSIGAGSRLQGVVIAATTVPSLLGTVRLTATTIVEGQVFSTGVVENCGIVRGPLMCRRLLYHSIGSYFENCLVNCTLDRAALPPAFLSTRLLNPNGGNGVMIWLD